MKNSDYWKDRFQQMENARHESSAEKIIEIQEQINKAQHAIEEKINAWYQRFAINNNLSLVEAQKQLNSKELKELKWDVHEYIKYGEENAVDQRWMKELENASARVHISRLEQIKLQTQQYAEMAFGNYNDILDNHIKDIYKQDYFHTAYEIQKGTGVGYSFAGLDEDKVDKIVNKPWASDGANFSDRIWTNKQKLVNQLHTSLTQMCITGEGPDRAIKEIAKAMGSSKYQAGRLVMTESAYFGSQAQKDCFRELDVEKYEIVATLDSHTSDICQEMDGKVFNMSEYEAGVTAPPFHPNCRSCTCPHFDDDFAGSKRAARGEDGKTYYVPANMTYKEWEKSVVKEKGISGKKKDTDIDNKVDLEYIKSKEYKEKFSHITNDPQVNEKIYQCSKAALIHRAGTNKEDMYLVSSIDGKVKGRSNAGKVDFEVTYNNSLNNACDSEPKKTLISIHNHPTNLPPTGSDFASQGTRQYNMGVIPCHNGDVYIYQVGDKAFSQRLFDDTIEKYKKMGYTNDIEANIKTLEQFESDYGIKWRKM